ncbi:protein of unknown function [Legionella fallonii LLAP-10]|uniref:Uncharacterized protein n=1 Tax=Legionella fallonii LLAP-10 TaxID=1212491 RepID=A0A098G8R0_9GAMM|nr:protein of unknown function [Legionella fallonii LLAP-10]
MEFADLFQAYLDCRKDNTMWYTHKPHHRSTVRRIFAFNLYSLITEYIVNFVTLIKIKQQ